jgi:hypothetical protein
MTEIKLPFKSSPQAIRADPPCRTRQRTNPSPDGKKTTFSYRHFGRSNYSLLTKKKIYSYVFTTAVTSSHNLFSYIL